MKALQVILTFIICLASFLPSYGEKEAMRAPIPLGLAKKTTKTTQSTKTGQSGFNRQQISYERVHSTQVKAEKNFNTTITKSPGKTVAFNSLTDVAGEYNWSYFAPLEGDSGNRIGSVTISILNENTGEVEINGMYPSWFGLSNVRGIVDLAAGTLTLPNEQYLGVTIGGDENWFYLKTLNEDGYLVDGKYDIAHAEGTIEGLTITFPDEIVFAVGDPNAENLGWWVMSALNVFTNTSIVDNRLNYDLEAGAINAPSSVFKGESYEVSVSIKNKGKQDVVASGSDSAYSVKLYADVTNVSTQVMSTLRSGESTTAVFHLTMDANQVSPVVLYAEVDYLSDETPNYSDLRTTTISVSPRDIPNLHGYVIFADEWETEGYSRGLYNVSTETPELIFLGPGNAYGNIEIDGVIYCVEFLNYGEDLVWVYAYNAETGELIDWNRAGEIGWLTPSGFVKDPITGNIYGISYNDNGEGLRLAKFEFSPDCTITVTEIAPLDGSWNSLVCDAQGQLYGISYTVETSGSSSNVTSSTLNKINKVTGEVTPIGNTGKRPQYLSSAVIDYKSGRMFWNVCEADKKSLLCEVNLTTGQATDLFVYEGGEEIMGMFIPDHKIDKPIVETPIIRFKDRKIEISCTTDNVKIMYTSDGTEPKENVTAQCFEYTVPFLPESNCTIKAQAFKTGWDPSEIAQYTFNKEALTVKTPMVSFSNRRVEIKCETEEVKIMYTLDGSEPNENASDNCFEYTGPFLPETDCTIKAVAFKDNMLPSGISEYTFNREALTVKTPMISFSNRRIEIKCDTEEVKILYSLDGSDPIEAFSQTRFEFTEPFLPENNCTIKARAFKENMFHSDIIEFTFDREAVTTTAPIITFRGGKIVMTHETEGVKIMYTLNGSEPSENSSASCFKYTDPFIPTSDCMIRAVAYQEVKLPSPEATYFFNREELTVHTPLITFKNRMIEINCDTEDVKIMYTLDGSEPSENGSDICFEYTSAFLPSYDCTIKAAAFNENMLNSGIYSFTYNKGAFTVNTPSITPDFSGHRVVINHSIAAQSVQVISTKLDESTSEHTGTVPFEMDVTANMKSISVMALGGEDLFDSESVNFDINFVKTPTFHIMEDGRLEIMTEPSDARICYTVDGTTPTTLSNVYSDPLVIDDDVLVNAIGVKDNYFDSSVASFLKGSNLSVPTATVMNKRLILSSNEPLEGLRILYTLDGSDPIYGSEYTEPIMLPQQNVTVAFIAVHPDMYNSEVGQFNFIVADYTAEVPTFEYEYQTRHVFIRHELNGHPLNLRIMRNDGSEVTQEVNAPYYLSVESNMSQISVNAAETDQLFASTSVASPIEFTEAPILNFDGNYLTINLDTQDDDAIIRLGLDGYESTISGEKIYMTVSPGQKIQHNLLGSIVGVAYSNNKFFSDPKEITIDAWFDGQYGATRVAGAFKKALQWCGTDLNSFIQIEGPLNESDFATIQSCNGIEILALDFSSVNDQITIPSYAFAGTKIRWIVMEGGDVGCLYGSFGSAEELSFVYWKPSVLPQNNAFERVSNPNLILFTFVDEAPKDLGVNVVNNNKIDNLELVDGYPFDIRDTKVAWEFTADKISITRDFFQKTVPNNVRGWETIALPFSPTEITHSINGKCAPFTDTDAIAAGAKPFWLYAMTEDNQFERADHIEAFKPYLISMPNNEVYADRYILGGKVTFSASNVVMAPHPDDSERVAQVSFSRDDLGDGAFTLNVSPNANRHVSDEIVGGKIYGSVFLQDFRALRPFEGYFAANVHSSASHIPVFDSLSDIELPNIEYSSKYGLSVFVENGHVKLLSEYNRNVVITDMTGQVINRVEVPAGVMTDAGGFAPGIYIIGNQKIMIR